MLRLSNRDQTHKQIFTSVALFSFGSQSMAERHTLLANHKSKHFSVATVMRCGKRSAHKVPRVSDSLQKTFTVLPSSLLSRPLGFFASEDLLWLAQVRGEEWGRDTGLRTNSLDQVS